MAKKDKKDFSEIEKKCLKEYNEEQKRTSNILFPGIKGYDPDFKPVDTRSTIQGLPEGKIKDPAFTPKELAEYVENLSK